MGLLGIAHGVHELVVGVALALLTEDLHDLLVPRLERRGELTLLRAGAILLVLAGVAVGHF